MPSHDVEKKLGYLNIKKHLVKDDQVNTPNMQLKTSIGLDIISLGVHISVLVESWTVPCVLQVYDTVFIHR